MMMTVKFNYTMQGKQYFFAGNIGNEAGHIFKNMDNALPIQIQALVNEKDEYPTTLSGVLVTKRRFEQLEIKQIAVKQVIYAATTLEDKISLYK